MTNVEVTDLMKQLFAFLLCCAFGVVLAQDPAKPAAEAKEEPKAEAKEDTKPEAKEEDKKEETKTDDAALMKKGSYLLGLNIGMNIGRQFFNDEIDREQFIKGLQEAMSGDFNGDPSGFRETAEAFFKSLDARRQKAYETQKEAGEKFLEANGKKEGVTALPSGLQYKIIKSGKDGAETPTLVSQVSCHYRGTLIDGTEFDSSKKSGDKKPVTFPTRGVIRGWTEALQLMKVGDKWQLFIPENLAYGRRGSPPSIPPGSTLIFEIELLEVKPLPQPKQPNLLPIQPPPQG